ncbi:TIGR03750 family conjugal transfer protein [Psychromonas sp. B3M02]|uniref:TIGR03750 family conjugal transfer protein n=1 Tax=Psychromonas sp. B3M02 TaxID=2267226 RepID=UPI0015F10340|nr:TIGR03750 family conjugal transfer protein [Psychromonas sp. B3M02]
MKTAQFVPNRLNEQPVILRGCSWPEIYSIVRVSLLIGFSLSLAITLVLGNYTYILAITPVITAILFMRLTKRMSNIKNGRPVGYFILKNNLKKQRSSFSTKRFFIEHDGFWKVSKD